MANSLEWIPGTGPVSVSVPPVPILRGTFGIHGNDKGLKMCHSPRLFRLFPYGPHGYTARMGGNLSKKSVHTGGWRGIFARRAEKFTRTAQYGGFDVVYDNDYYTNDCRSNGPFQPSSTNIPPRTGHVHNSFKIA